MSKQRKSLFGMTGKAKEQLIQASLNKRSEASQKSEGANEIATFSGERRLKIDGALCRFDSYQTYKDIQIQKKPLNSWALIIPFSRAMKASPQIPPMLKEKSV